MIRKRSLCECFGRSSLTLPKNYTAGARAQGLSLSPLTSSRPPTTPHSRPLYSYVFTIPKPISTSLKVLLAIRLLGSPLQDQQPEEPSHLRPSGAVHRMHFSSRHFGMSPCHSIFHSHGCRRHYSRIVLFQRAGCDVGYQHRRRPCQEILDAVHPRWNLCQGPRPWRSGRRRRNVSPIPASPCSREGKILNVIFVFLASSPCTANRLRAFPYMPSA